jgi:hypothetical protein
VSDAKGAPDAAICDQLAAAAQTQVQSYLDSTSSMACQVDSDCSLLHLQSVNCFAACGLLVGTADVSAVTAAVSTSCDPYFGVGCPEIALSCPYFPAFCNHGKCDNTMSASSGGAGGSSNRTGGAGGSGGVSSAGSTGQVSTGGAGGASDATVAPDASVCDQLSAAAWTQFQSYLDSRPMTCQSDSDCPIVGLVHLCFPSCGFRVETADVSAVTAAAAAVCDQYFAAGCPAIVLLCPP